MTFISLEREKHQRLVIQLRERKSRGETGLIIRNGKTHGSESRGQETTKRTPQLKRAATTVSYLRVGTVSQYY